MSVHRILMDSENIDCLILFIISDTKCNQAYHKYFAKMTFITRLI